MEALQAQLQQITAQLQAQALSVQELQAQNQYLRARSDEQGGVAELARAVQAQSAILAHRSRPSLVDSKGIGKPTQFSNREADWAVWSKKLVNFIGAVHSDAGQVLEWAIDQSGEVTSHMLSEAFGEDADEGDRVHDLGLMDHEIFTVLTQMTDAEAFDIVQNAGAGRGFEAWRRLGRRFDPSTGGRRRNLLRSIIAPPRVKLDEVAAALERWEDLCMRYCRQRDSSGGHQTLSDDLRVAAIESLVPEDLEKHLLMNQGRLGEDFAAVRQEIMLYIEARTGQRLKDPRVTGTTTNRDAMDVDAGSLGKGGKGGKGAKGSKGGKDGGKGRGAGGKATGRGGDAAKPPANSQFPGECRNCGKWGHKARECWSKPRAATAPAAGAGRGSGGAAPKGGKAKGKGGKAANTLEESGEQEPNPESAAAALDICAVAPATEGMVCGICRPGAWVKINVDTGAAQTALPLDAAAGAVGESTGAMLKTATGEHISDSGRAAITGVDELGVRRRIKGTLAPVHKVLLSAAQACSLGQDLWVGSDGGHLMSRRSPICIGLRAKFDELLAKHGPEGLIPVHCENGVYNMYVMADGPAKVLGAVDAPSLPGGLRRAALPP